jgi:aspartyl-tRNA(Asn)/glutamyl-tRNA(Gln) amidotransferase subunit B
MSMSARARGDYRYFPEPDLPPVVVDEAWLAAARAALPELPEARHARLTGLGLSAQDVSVLVAERPIGDYFDAALATAPAHPKKLANWLINEVLGRVADARQLMDPDVPVPPAALAELVGSAASREAERERAVGRAGGEPRAWKPSQGFHRQ